MTLQWTIYEATARKVISDMRMELGVSHVEGKQNVAGTSGTSWEVDAIAWCEAGEKFLLVEARRHTSSGLKQEEVAAIAYRIGDIGASGAILVSPKPLQRGAKLVAASEGVLSIRLDPDSTPERYLAEYLDRRFIGVTASDSIHVSDSADAVVLRGTHSDA